MNNLTTLNAAADIASAAYAAARAMYVMQITSVSTLEMLVARTVWFKSLDAVCAALGEELDDDYIPF